MNQKPYVICGEFFVCLVPGETATDANPVVLIMSVVETAGGCLT